MNKNKFHFKYTYKYRAITPLKLREKNLPHCKWQKVIYFPNCMLNNYQLLLHFDIYGLSQNQFTKKLKIQTSQRERIRNLLRSQQIDLNLKENISCVHHLKNSLCHVMLKLAQWFWRKRSFKFCQCNFAILLLSLFNMGCGSSFEQSWIPYT